MTQRTRVSINLDAAGALLDRALDHPLARLAEELAPEAMAGVRELRQNLPDVAAGLQAATVKHLRDEAAAVTGGIEKKLAQGLRGFLDEVLTKSGARAAPARRRGPRKARTR